MFVAAARTCPCDPPPAACPLPAHRASRRRSLRPTRSASFCGSHNPSPSTQVTIPLALLRPGRQALYKSKPETGTRPGLSSSCGRDRRWQSRRNCVPARQLEMACDQWRGARLLGDQLPQGFERRVPLALLRLQRGAVVPQQRAGRLQIGGRALIDQVLQQQRLSQRSHPQGGAPEAPVLERTSSSGITTSDSAKDMQAASGADSEQMAFAGIIAW